MSALAESDYDAALAELVALIKREHELVTEAGRDRVEHAIRSGDALRRAREVVPYGRWGDFLAKRLGGPWHERAAFYMRLSEHQDAIRAAGADSLSQAARVLNETLPPTERQQHARAAARRRDRAREARRALKWQEQQKEAKVVIRKRGGALAEAYAMAERFQDVIAQAQREATGRDVRNALAMAGQFHHSTRDYIVRAALHLNEGDDTA